MQLFISYSHKDKLHMTAMETHLAGLRRSGVITSWTDRAIVPGEQWEEAITEKLHASDLVAFLVSADFLNSDYCYEKEMKDASERHKNSSAIVIPIIIRACDWEDTPLKHLQALPADAKPVTSWLSPDDAWLDVIRGLKRVIAILKSRISSNPSHQLLPASLITPEFQTWLEDTEITLWHRAVPTVTLSDIFVPPDLKVLYDDTDRISKSISPEISLQKSNHILIFGDEQSGKTSLCKYYFKELYKKQLLPVFIDAKDIKTSDIAPLIKRQLEAIYSPPQDGHYHTPRAVIVDNFSNCSLNAKHRWLLVGNLTAAFQRVILITSDTYKYVIAEFGELDPYRKLEILPFGHVKRAALIEQWVSLGVLQQIDDTDLYSRVDEETLRIEFLTKDNILPKKPIFILALLQTSETLTAQNFDLSSYGHCYQYLMYQALERAYVKKSDFDTYFNCLTELAWAQYVHGDPLNTDELEDFYKRYGEKYLASEIRTIIDSLTRSSILVWRNERLCFKYPYIYYYFTAKYLAESLRNDEVAQRTVRTLLENTHREDCANIIIFITHHSKDPWVLDEIQISLMDLFSKYAEADLEKPILEFLQDFIKGIPSLVIENRTVALERQKRYSSLDQIDQDLPLDSDRVSLDATSLLAIVNKVFRGMEIIGQIIRNRHGSLGKEHLKDMAWQAYGAGLRLLEFFLKVADAGKEEVIRVIQEKIYDDPNVSVEKLEKAARELFLYITYASIYGILSKVASSVGSKEAAEIYDSIEISHASPAVKLINQSIRLQFNKSVDHRRLQSLAEEFRKNPVCERILKEMFIRHIYMFPVDYKDKQRISQALDIPMDAQMLALGQKAFQL